MEFGDLLMENFLKWQSRLGERKTFKEFSEFIGISESYLNLLINKRKKPSPRVIKKLVKRIDDPRFYEFIEFDYPDEGLQSLKSQYDLVPQAEKDKFLDEVRKLLIEHGWVKED